MPKSNHSMALPREAALTARLTAASSVTVMSDRRSRGFCRRLIARKRAGWRRTAAASVSGPFSVGDVAASLSTRRHSGRSAARSYVSQVVPVPPIMLGMVVTSVMWLGR